ncbi:MAG: cupin domain-containing protein [Gammaproteobacteria bacterium]
MNLRFPRLSLLIILAHAWALPASLFAHGDDHTPADATKPPDYAAASHGTRELALGGVTIRMLADASNLARDDIEVGELNLPVEYGEGAAHSHGSLELFYVVDGVLGHEVNGTMHRLEPGMLGFVKPGDSVRHTVMSAVPVKAVVIWVPGGEADRLVEHAGFTVKPAD